MPYGSSDDMSNYDNINGMGGRGMDWEGGMGGGNMGGNIHRGDNFDPSMMNPGGNMNMGGGNTMNNGGGAMGGNNFGMPGGAGPGPMGKT